MSDHHATRRGEIATALRTTRKLERPDTISPRLWLGVHRLLVELAKHMPDPFPSEARLAARTGLSLATVERYIRTARECGLITAEAVQMGRGWKHNRYALAWLNAPQTEGLISTTSLRDYVPTPTENVPPSVGKTEPPTAAAAALSSVSNEPEEPQWYPGWDPARQLGLPADTMFRRNLYPAKCKLCSLGVKAGKGWVTEKSPGNGPGWWVVHDPICPRMLEGSRGEPIRTIGESFANWQEHNERQRRARSRSQAS